MSKHPYKDIAGIAGCAQGFTDPGPVCGRPASDPIHVITLQDMTNRVTVALGSYSGDFDIPGIVEHIHQIHGLIDVNGLSPAEFWRFVQLHDASETASGERTMSGE